MQKVDQSGIYIGNAGQAQGFLNLDKRIENASFAKMIQVNINREDGILTVMYCGIWDRIQHKELFRGLCHSIFDGEEYKIHEEFAYQGRKRVVDIMGAGFVEIRPDMIIGYGVSAGFNIEPNENHLRKVAGLYNLKSKVDIDHEPDKSVKNI
ncbi:hypothetical protein H6503_05535 [Candidatus Woesearchaeota archaeon]|nr:hypothetical protein [Candidatus Woesearchaeota archaeon]